MNPRDIPNIQLNNGFSIPQLGLGVFKMSPKETRKTVRHALELGYRHFDTASIYENEKALGKAIAKSGIAREELFITTKLWNSDHNHAGDALRRSLDLLGLETVDLYLIHWPLPMHNTSVGAWRQLLNLLGEGLIKSIGVSNFEIEHLGELITETGVVPAVNQIELHPLHQRRELRDYCASINIAVEAWGPLAQGKTNLLELPEVTETALQLGKTPAQVVLRWLVQQQVIVIPKTVQADRLAENAALFDFELSDEQMAAIDSLDQQHNVGPDPYAFDRK